MLLNSWQGIWILSPGFGDIACQSSYVFVANLEKRLFRYLLKLLESSFKSTNPYPLASFRIRAKAARQCRGSSPRAIRLAVQSSSE